MGQEDYIMLPDNVLSTASVIGNYIGAKALNENSRLSYEDGGIGLNDSSQGLNVQVWYCKLVGEDVVVSPINGTSTILFTATGITELSLSFDSSMQPAVAYIQDGVAKLRWYDTTIPGYDVINLGTAIKSPKIVLDDKRPSQNSNRDIILAYIKSNGDFCYREQRDRFTIEYILSSGLTSNIHILKMGLNDKLRLQFSLGEPISSVIC